MYAIIEDGSRQHRVSRGDVVRLDFRDVDTDTEIELDRVLLFQTDSDLHIGRPVVDGARVIARVVKHTSVKTYIQKFRRRKNYKRLTGHRQPYIAVEILDLLMPGWERSAPEEKPEEQERDERADEETDEEQEQSQAQGPAASATEQQHGTDEHDEGDHEDGEEGAAGEGPRQE